MDRKKALDFSYHWLKSRASENVFHQVMQLHTKLYEKWLHLCNHSPQSVQMSPLSSTWYLSFPSHRAALGVNIERWVQRVIGLSLLWLSSSPWSLLPMADIVYGHCTLWTFSFKAIVIYNWCHPCASISMDILAGGEKLEGNYLGGWCLWD